MKARTVLFVLAATAMFLLGWATTGWSLDPAELQAFLEVGMNEEVLEMCAANAAEVAKNPSLQNLCNKAKSGGGGAPAEPPPSAPPSAPPSSPPPSAPPSGFPSGAPSAPPSTPAGKPTVPSGPAPVITAPAGLGLDAKTFESMVAAGQYAAVVTMCNDSASAIENHPDRDLILKACGKARMMSYSSKQAGSTALTGAMGDLEKSLKQRYDKVASFDLGRSRLLSLDTIPSAAEKIDQEKKAIREMWDSIVMRHAEEGFPEAVSDQIIVWTVGDGTANNPGFVDMVIDRIIKDEDNPGMQRWLGARIRMLTDRFTNINPGKGESDVRRGNLEALKTWMTELLQLSYFDNNVMVGVYRYKANRSQEAYDQTTATEDLFHKAVYFYEEGRKRAATHKAKASLDLDVAYLCSRYRSDNPGKLIEFYKLGFLHSRRGLRLMAVVDKVNPEQGKSWYRHDVPNGEVTSKLQKAYGDTLTGWIYNMYLQKDFKGVVAQKNYALNAGFDWDNKSDVLLLFAESSKELAGASLNSEMEYRKYKEMCLAAGSRAFNFVLRKYGGKLPPARDENFCKVFNAYWNYLDGFGQTIEAKDIDRKFGTVCPAN